MTAGSLARAVGWLLVFAVVGVGVTIGLSVVAPAVGGSAWRLARYGVEQATGFAVATLVVGRWLDRHTWDALGWRTGRLTLRVASGVGTGIALAACAVGCAWLVGGASVRLTPNVDAWPRVAGPLAVGLAAAALSEELAFRGYPLRRLSEAVGPTAAIAVGAAGFAAVHLANPDASPFSTANIALAGAWLSLAFLSPGGMPLAWGLHLGWNGGLLLFDAPVSGYRFDVPGVDYAPGAHPWIDGGAFGPEGGLVATLALGAGVALVLGRGLRTRPSWLTA